MARKALLMLFMVGICMAGVQEARAQADYSGLLRTHWARIRKMNTDIVAAMPEDKWDFKPVPEVRSFREMASHLITDGISHTGWAAGISREESDKIASKYEHLKTKDEILKGLGEMFDYGDMILSKMTDESARDMVVGMRSQPMTKFEAALVAFDDQIDHYGNMVVYLRINGVVPPSTANSAAEREANRKKAIEMGLIKEDHEEGEHQH